jgi:hypothetical protein
VNDSVGILVSRVKRAGGRSRGFPGKSHETILYVFGRVVDSRKEGKAIGFHP